VSSALSICENGAYVGTENEVKFCVKLQKSPDETLEMLKTSYDESAVSKSNVFNLHKCFREGREDVNDNERQGAPIMK
jgi:hypothetical protein